jgi:hypothetical protein
MTIDLTRRRTNLGSAVLLACLAMLAPACAPDDATEPDDNDLRLLDSHGLVTLYPTALTSTTGSNSRQPITVLASATLTGTTDTWADYIELTPATGGYRGTFSFRLPADVPRTAVTAFDVRVNVRGDRKSRQLWQWQLRDVAAGTWKTIGDNSAARSWVWSVLSFTVSDAGRYVASDGSIKLRIVSPSRRHVLDLDYLAIEVYADAGTPPPQADAGTKPPQADASAPPPQADAGTPPPQADAGTKPPSGTIWQPHPGTTWQWQLTGTVDTSVNAQAYDIDLEGASASLIATLHGLGRKVICYFDVAYENYRSDASSYPAEVLGNVMDGWPDERWVDIRNPVILQIMSTRMDSAVQKGCDAIEADDIEVYSNNPGFPITLADNVAFAKALAAAAHARGLAIGLKNFLDAVPQLVGSFDFAINEQCFQYSECDTLLPFVNANKSVFQCEYRSKTSAICDQANSMNLDTIFKNLDLDVPRDSCR